MMMKKHRQTQVNQDGGVVPLLPLSFPEGEEGEHRQQHGDFSKHPCSQEPSGEDLDIPLDHSDDTTLHWAAILAVLPLLKALVAGGATIARVNNGGETALMRAVSATKNADRAFWKFSSY
jgi:hypothetical protein